MVNQGPSAQSVLTGNCVYSADIESDSKMKPWKTPALKHGFHSSIALPLKVSGNVVGILNLYSENKNIFNQEELTLLEELAMDISFALEYIEQEQDRKEAESQLRESEIRYREMVENLNEMIGLHDMKGNLLSVNKATEKVTEYSREELLKMNVRDIVWDSYQPLFDDYLKEIKTKGRANGYMYQNEVR